MKTGGVAVLNRPATFCQPFRLGKAGLASWFWVRGSSFRRRTWLGSAAGKRFRQADELSDFADYFGERFARKFSAPLQFHAKFRSTIGFSAMPHAVDANHANLIGNLINHSVVADADAP